MTLGERLKAIRKEKKMTQQQLADALGVQPAAIYKYEKNIVSPSFEQLTVISNTLGVAVMDLIADPFDSTESDNLKIYRLEDLFIGAGHVAASMDEKKNTINDYYERLNKRGQRKAVSYVRDLSENPKYKK